MAGAVASETQDPRQGIRGVWGFELVDDMTCAVNPVQISLAKNGKQLVFSWPKSVEYSDGSVSDGVSFTILRADKTDLTVRRDRDGIRATFTVAADGLSFYYEEEGPEEGSRFDRCEGPGS